MDQVDYFNLEIAEWEPCLEYWPLAISRHVQSQDGGVDTKWEVSAQRNAQINLTQVIRKAYVKRGLPKLIPAWKVTFKLL